MTICLALSKFLLQIYTFFFLSLTRQGLIYTLNEEKVRYLRFDYFQLLNFLLKTNVAIFTVRLYQ